MLLPELPRLAHYFGLKPPDIDHLTIREVSEFMEALHDLDTGGDPSWQVGVESLSPS